MMKCVLVLSGLLLTNLAQAEFSTAEMQAATNLAIEDYSRDNGSHAVHLSGWKVWKSGDAVKIKLYIAHDGMTMEENFECHKHSAADIQCHLQ